MTKDQYVASAISLLAMHLRLSTCQLRSDVDRLAADIVNGRMSTDSLTKPEIEELLDRISASTPDSFEHQKAADAVIAALTRYKRFAGDAASPTTPRQSGSTKRMPVAVMRSGPFYGMGIRDAAFDVIKRGGKQTAREIWSVLEAGGFTSAHKDPAHAVQSGLAKRALMQKDVFLVGEGKWDLCELYPEEERARITEALNGQAGRDARHHRASTVAGMLVARARGARLGAKKKLEPDQLAKIEEMVRTGTSVAAAAKAFGISPGTVYNNIPRERIADLREEADKLKSEGVPPEEVRH